MLNFISWAILRNMIVIFTLFMQCHCTDLIWTSNYFCLKTFNVYYVYKITCQNLSVDYDMKCGGRDVMSQLHILFNFSAEFTEKYGW
jgi:hypothetical protein